MSVSTSKAILCTQAGQKSQGTIYWAFTPSGTKAVYKWIHVEVGSDRGRAMHQRPG